MNKLDEGYSVACSCLIHGVNTREHILPFCLNGFLNDNIVVLLMLYSKLRELVK